MAQLVKHLTVDLSSGHDLTVREFEPHVGLCTDSSEPGACFGFCLPLSLSVPPLLTLCLSVSLSLSLSLKNKKNIKKKLKDTDKEKKGFFRIRVADSTYCQMAVLPFGQGPSDTVDRRGKSRRCGSRIDPNANLSSTTC